MLFETVALCLLAFAFGASGAWIVARIGRRLGLLDMPNQRSSHQKATPKGGGVGILIAFVVTCLVLELPASFWIPLASLSLLSFLGDRRDLSIRTRLASQAGGSLVVLWGLIGNLQNHPPAYSFLIFGCFFMVATCNVYNFMDGIDGIAGATGVVACAFFGIYMVRLGVDSSHIAALVCMAFACLGFLPFNFPSARVFMGDVGSILLGSIFGFLIIWLSSSALDFFCLVAFLFPFYADEVTTMLVRLADGESLLRSHRRHLYQLCANEFGIPHWKVTLAYVLLQILIGACALVLRGLGGYLVLVLLIVAFIAFAVTSQCVRARLQA